MKIKTSDLIGPALDWAVAKCEGKGDYCEIHAGNVLYGQVTSGFTQYKPSTDWSQGGPIIERERIELLDDEPGWLARIDLWARRGNFGDRCVAVGGPTILIATMRCYVANKLGDEVNVPKELLDWTNQSRM